jgi:DNA repair protein RadC
MDDNAKFWKDLTSGRFASMVKESSKGQCLSNSLEAYHVLKPLFAKEDDVERMYFIFLDSKNRILGIESLFSGTLQTCSIYTREVVKRLLGTKAAAFVIGHNHPSGDITPSLEDHSITIKIGIAAAAIDVVLHDHLIVGDGYHSMADTGWLKKVTRQFSNLLKSNPTMKGEES